MKTFNKIFVLFGLGCCAAGCKKLVEAPPQTTAVSSASVFNSNSTAIAAMNGVYSNISGSGFFAAYNLNAVSWYAGLSADELTLYPANIYQDNTYYYTNALTSSNTNDNNFWVTLYSQLYPVNSVISGVSASATLTPAVKQQLLGEAKFMRALSYFYLVNLYGDVPLITGTDYKVNNATPRSPQADVWKQIIADLKDAETLLSPTYLDGTLLNSSTARIRPVKYAAASLLARAYLYTEDYANAAKEASTVIGKSQYQMEDLNSAFLMNNTEAIWQLQPTANGVNNTLDAQNFILPSTGPNFYQCTYLSDGLVNAFEPGDQRKVNWIGSVTANGTTYYYPYKYKVNDPAAASAEYETILRLSEQYLIRSEAEAHLGDMADAAKDLNVVRHRAGLPPSTVLTAASTLAQAQSAILQERRVELFTELGHRWLDIKRTKTVDAVMGAPGNACQAKGGTWNTDWQLYPVPESELKSATRLTQNPGY